MANDAFDFNEDDLRKFLDGVYDGTIDPGNLPDDLYKSIADYLFKGVENGFGAAIENVQFGTPDFELLESLRDNIYMFSAAKTFQQTMEMSEALVDKDGNLLSQKEFREIATDIFAKYNGSVEPGDERLRGWLDTERNTAITQASNAAKWNSIQKNKDVLPYLRYVSEGDDLVCDICDPFDGITLPVDDPFWDENAPSNHFNCRCLLEQLDADEGGRAESDDDDIETAIEDSPQPDEFKYNPGQAGEIFSTEGKSQHPYFSVPNEYRELAADNFGLPIPEIDLRKQFEEFPRQPLKGEDAKLQEKSIKYYMANRKKLTAEYLKDNGNIVNTDEARKQFIDLGYNGTNASAVHEASSALSKDALNELIARGENDHIVFYAGGAGSGKTSAIEGLFPDLRQSADAIIDGNLAHFEGALKKIDSFLNAGKSVDINYVYRNPDDAWRGVINRMLHNKKEMGRLVPLKTFLENTTGSYETIATIINDTKLMDLENFNLNIIDNSLGKGNADFMDMKKFDSITYNQTALRKELTKITKGLLDDGTITQKQYDALIN